VATPGAVCDFPRKGRILCSSVSGRDTRADSPPGKAVGWSRAGQDAAEAELPDVEPEEPERVPFLDRRVGYVTYRWAVVPLGGALGALVGLFVGGLVTPPPQPGDWLSDRGIGIVAGLGIGFVAGALAGGVGLLVRGARSFLFDEGRGTWHQRVGDWLSLR
jgi:hypothetical protein